MFYHENVLLFTILERITIFVPEIFSIQYNFLILIVLFITLCNDN